MLKQIFKPKIQNYKFPFLVLLSSLLMIGILSWPIHAKDPGEYYSFVCNLLIMALSVMASIISLASWGNNVTMRIKELEKEIEKLKRPEK